MNVVVVGGEWAILQRGLGPKLEDLGLHIVHHHSWDERGPMTTFPRDAEGVIILKSVISHSVSIDTMKAASAKGLKVAVVDHKLSFALPVLKAQGFLSGNSIVPVEEQVLKSAREYIEEVRSTDAGRAPGYDEVVEKVAEGLGIPDVQAVYGRKQYGKDIAETTPVLVQVPAEPPPEPAPAAPPGPSKQDVVDTVAMYLDDEPIRATHATAEIASAVQSLVGTTLDISAWVDDGITGWKAKWRKVPAKGPERVAFSELKQRFAEQLMTEAAKDPALKTPSALARHTGDVLIAVFGSSVNTGFLQKMAVDARAGTPPVPAVPKSMAEQLMDLAAFVEEAQQLKSRVDGVFDIFDSLETRVEELAGKQPDLTEVRGWVQGQLAAAESARQTLVTRVESIGKQLGELLAAQRVESTLAKKVEALQTQIRHHAANVETLQKAVDAKNRKTQELIDGATRAAAASYAQEAEYQRALEQMQAASDVIVEGVRVALRDEVRAMVREMMGGVAFVLRPEFKEGT